MLITKYLEQLNAPKKSFFGKVDSMFSNFKDKINKEAAILDQKYDLSTKKQNAIIMAKGVGDKLNEKAKEFSVKY